MGPSNRFLNILLFFAFSAIFVSGGGVHSNLSKERGLTASCVKRVLATCATSQPSNPLAPLEMNCDAAETETLRRALEDLSIGQRDLLHFLKEWLKTNKIQEKSLLDIKNGVLALKEAASRSLIACENSNAQEESSLLKEIKAQRLLFEDVKTSFLQNSIVSEMQKSLSKMQENMTEQFNSLFQVYSNSQTKKERSLSEIKEMLKKTIQSRSFLPQTTPPNQKYTPKNCADILKRGDKKSGIRTVHPFTCDKNLSLAVFCDQTTDGGGWTVFQYRNAFQQREDFFRTWQEYRNGFGDLTKEFWLGLDNIYAFVSGSIMEMRVDLEDFEGQKKWAKYEEFFIDDAAGKYRLYLEGYSGDAGDSLMKRHSGMVFSTKDQDNDNWSKNCAEIRHGGWWYDDCTDSNLNGFQFHGKFKSANVEGIYWHLFRGDRYSLKSTSMKMRPKLRK